MMNLEDSNTVLLDNSLKGYPHDAAPCTVGEIGQRHWQVLRGDLPFPIALLKESALIHNLQWMRDFATTTGVLLAPHGKTTMAPQLFARQLDAGAWGITFATMQQVHLGVQLGLRRIILANQLIGEQDIALAVRLVNTTPDLAFFFLIDSTAQLDMIERFADTHGLTTPLTALLELGIAGGRTGVRGADAAVQVARRIAASRHVLLAGVECYEGLQVTGDSAQDRVFIDDLMAQIRQVAQHCDTDNLFGTPTIILSAGGSAVFDLVARSLPAVLSRPVQTILRSGCYITHDAGFYARFAKPMLERLGGDAFVTSGGLQPALEVWSQVQSCPEPGLAILALGKRDASYDMDLPVPFARVRGDDHTALDHQWQIRKLNDQHAYLFCPPAATIEVGDLVGCGISHPCTTFDKWRWLPVVDDGYAVIAAVKTYF